MCTHAETHKRTQKLILKLFITIKHVDKKKAGDKIKANLWLPRCFYYFPISQFPILKPPHCHPKKTQDYTMVIIPKD